MSINSQQIQSLQTNVPFGINIGEGDNAKGLFFICSGWPCPVVPLKDWSNISESVEQNSQNKLILKVHILTK